MTSQVIVGDCRQTLAILPEENVHSIVTSFPYWNLRAYSGTDDGIQAVTWADGTTCPWGLEPTFAAWVDHCVEVSRLLKRVLRKDGTFWLNIGASYAGKRSFKGGKKQDGVFARRAAGIAGAEGATRDPAFKDGDLVQQGPLLAEALRKDGWWLKSAVIAEKTNPKPDSAKNRPANVYEHFFLLTRSKKYFYDDTAVLQPYARKTLPQRGSDYQGQDTKDRGDGSESASDVKRRIIASMEERGGRNLRSVIHDPGSVREALQHAVDTHDPRFLNDVGRAIYAEWCRIVEVPLLLALVEAQVGGDGTAPEHWDWSAIEALSEEVKEPGSQDLWVVNNQAVPGAHTATFPESLVETCIKAGCPVGGIVLDPCGGSGTVGVVSERLGRDSILLELSPLYAAQAEARIADPEWSKKQRVSIREERKEQTRRDAELTYRMRRTIKDLNRRVADIDLRERASSYALEDKRERDCVRVVAEILFHGDRTADEVDAALNLGAESRDSTVSARCADLKRAGVIRETGKKRPTKRGVGAAVLEIDPSMFEGEPSAGDASDASAMQPPGDEDDLPF